MCLSTHDAVQWHSRVKFPHGEIGPATSGYPVLIWLGFNAIFLFFSSTVLVQQFRGLKKQKENKKKKWVLGAIICHAGWVRSGCCRGWRLICALSWGDIFRPVESTQTLVQFIQFGWQGDPQLLVEGQSFKPVFQLLERWTKRGGGGGKTSRKGTQRGLGLKPDWQGWEKTWGSNLAAEACPCAGRSRWHLKAVVFPPFCFNRCFKIK